MISIRGRSAIWYMRESRFYKNGFTAYIVRLERSTRLLQRTFLSVRNDNKFCHCNQFLGESAKLRQAIIRFVHVCLSARLFVFLPDMEQLCSHKINFDTRVFFDTLSTKFHLIRIVTLRVKTDVQSWYIDKFFLGWAMVQTNVVDRIKIHLMFNNFFSKTFWFMRQCGKILYSQTGHRGQ